MSLFSKILIGFVFLAALPYFYFAARTLRTLEGWRSAVQRTANDVERARAANELLELGDDAARKQEIFLPLDVDDAAASNLGVRQLEVALDQIVVDRGTAWFGCEPQQVNADTGEARVLINQPVPHNVAEKTVLYAIEERPAEGDPSGVYLGEFRVTAVADREVVLQPTMLLTQREKQRLSQSQGTWTLYQVMPVDRPRSFVGLDEARLNELLRGVTDEARRADIVQQYVRDGQAAQAGEEAPVGMTIVENTLRRNLRDYASIFQDLHGRTIDLDDRIVRANSDLASLTKTVQRAQAEVAERDGQIRDLNAELTESRGEEQLATTQAQAVADRVAELERQLAQMVAASQRLAAEWTALQTEQAAAIEAAAAQANAGE